MIICLGESIVTIGVGAVGAGGRGRPLSAELVAAVSLSMLITIGLWWTYFDRFVVIAEQRLRDHDDPVLAAADAYSYLHLVIVAGIIIFAVGANSVVHDVSGPLRESARLALCGGVALYLLGHVAFRLRMVGAVGYEKAVVAIALIAVFAFGGGLPASSVAAAVGALLVALCAFESTADRRAGSAEREPRSGADTTGPC